MPISYVDLTTTHSRLTLIGVDAARYLNGQVSNDVHLCSGTRGISACVCNAKGKLEGTINIAAIENGYLADFPAMLDESLPPRLEKYLIADECEWSDRSGDTLHLHFPEMNVEALEKILSLPTMAISNQTRYGQRGADIVVEQSHEQELMSLLEAAEAHAMTDDEIQSLRIGNHAPAWGAEITTDSLPQELGLETDHISFTKGCYIGQETISRIKSVGRVNRQLVAVRSKTPDSPLALGAEIRLAAQDDNSKPLGAITSIDSSNQMGLAVVHRKALEPEAEIIASNTQNSLSTPLIILQSNKDS